MTQETHYFHTLNKLIILMSFVLKYNEVNRSFAI